MTNIVRKFLHLIDKGWLIYKKEEEAIRLKAVKIIAGRVALCPSFRWKDWDSAKGIWRSSTAWVPDWRSPRLQWTQVMREHYLEQIEELINQVCPRS